MDIPWSDFQFQSLILACTHCWQDEADRQSISLDNVRGVKHQGENYTKRTAKNQESPRPCPICTSCAGGDAGVIGIGFRFCGSRQLSKIPTCCTHETVHRAAQNFSVKYSRCRISGVYCASGIPGYPRCCEHQCTSPSSQMYSYREPDRQRHSCSFPRATLC